MPTIWNISDGVDGKDPMNISMGSVTILSGASATIPRNLLRGLWRKYPSWAYHVGTAAPPGYAERRAAGLTHTASVKPRRRGKPKRRRG